MWSWVREPRVAGTKEMTYGWLPGYSNEHFGLLHADGSPLAFTKLPRSLSLARAGPHGSGQALDEAPL